MADPIVLTTADLASGVTAQRFDGATHGGGIGVSFFVNHTPPGRGPGAHRHPYAEVFVLLDGEAAFEVDGRALTARGGQIVVVPPRAWHGFTNAGERTLEMLSIHDAAEMDTEWQEEDQ